MATITSLGAGSGLELESLVSKLMTAESIPLTALKKKQSSFETKISALGSLRSALASLQTAAKDLAANTLQKPTDKFATYTATIANTAIASATAGTGAVSGKYSLEVSNLAESHRLNSTTFASSSTSITATGGKLTLDMGTLNGSTYTADTNRSYSISLSAGATLANLRDAINDTDAGVTATIINGTAGAQLVLTSEEGTTNVMRLSSSNISSFDFDPEVSGAQDWTQAQGAEDAAFSLNGIAATSHSNKVTTAIDGVTLELTGTNVGAATTLNISAEFSTNITKGLQAFVTAYNSAYSTMTSLSAYNAETKVAGTLQGNSTLRLAMGQIRQDVFSITSGNAASPYQTLSDIGVSINTSGQLAINSSKLEAAIKADPKTVSDLLSKVGDSFDKKINNLIGTDGSITIASSGLSQTVRDLTNQQTKMQERLAGVEKRYRAQFSAMDNLVSSLNTTGNFLTSFISSLSKN